MFKWPDISMYGIRLTATLREEGKGTLSIVGAIDSEIAPKLRRLGFRREPAGSWLRSGVNDNNQLFEVIKKEFPEMSILAEGDICHDGTVMKRSSCVIDRRPQEEREPVVVERTTDNARILGKNSRGATVYKAVNGERFLKYDHENTPQWADEALIKSDPARFLLATSPESLSACTYGLVPTLSHTPLRIYEFRNFIRALYDLDADAEISEERMKTVFDSMNESIARYISNEYNSRNKTFGSANNVTFNDIYKTANTIFENYRIPEAVVHADEQYLSPIIASTFSRILSPNSMTKLQGEEDTTVKGTFYGVDNTLLFSSLLIPSQEKRNINIAIYEPDEKKLNNLKQGIREINLSSQIKVFDEPIYVEAPRLGFINITPEILPYEEDISGLKTSRQDIISLLDSLSQRNSHGRTVAIIHNMSQSGTDEEITQLHRYLTSNYEVEGTAILDSTVSTGAIAGNQSWAFAIGKKRDEALEFEAIKEDEKFIMNVDEPNKLWTWGSSVLSMRVRYYENDVQKQEEELNGQDIGGNKYQMPYSSMSRTRTPTTMTPKNMQAPTIDLQRRILSEIQMPVDEWLAPRLGYANSEEMAKSLSPEQIDAVTAGIKQFSKTRSEGDGFLVADDMGVGKGRTMVSMGAYSLITEEDGRVIYVTEYASSFSDIMREIKSTGQDKHMDVFMINNNAEIIDEASGEVTHKALPSDLITGITSREHWPDGQRVRIIKLDNQEAKRLNGIYKKYRGNNKNLTDEERVIGEFCDTFLRKKQITLIGEEETLPDFINVESIKSDESHFPKYNTCLTTYSQFNRASMDVQINSKKRNKHNVVKNDKAQWFVSVSGNNGNATTTLLLDEAHNAASRSSNMSMNVELAVDKAHKVAYASATWAKDIKNLFVYKRALPSNMNLENVSSVLVKGGDAMKETFTIMLIRNGAYIRREIDMSKCDFQNVIDISHRERNVDFINRIAPILSSVAVLCGTINERVSLMNNMRIVELERENRDEDRVGGVNNDRGLFNATSFGSPLNMVSKLIARSLLMEHTAETAINALKEGRKPIVQLHSTLEKMINEVKGNSDHVPDIRDVLKRVITRISVVKNRHGQKIDFSKQIAEFDINDRATFYLLDRIPDCVKDLNPSTLIKNSRKEGLTSDEMRMELLQTFEVWKAENNVTDFKEYVASHLSDFYSNIKDQNLFDDIDIVKSVNSMRDAIDFEGSEELLINNIAEIKKRIPNNPATEINRILGMIDALPKLEINAIDYVKDRIAEAGYTCGEITGRSTHVVDNKLVKRDKEHKGVVKDKFNRGEYDALVINDAGSTAIDLHAGSRFSDQRQRELIIWELLEDISKVVQSFGRIYRFDSVNNPIFTRVVSDLPIELRLQIAMNAKMRSLSSISTSNRDTARLQDNAPDIINKVGDLVVSRYLKRNPDIAERLGITLDDEDEVEEIENIQGDLTDDAGKTTASVQAKHSANMVLSRVAMLLMVPEQRQVVKDIDSEYIALIEELDASGRNPLKLERMKGIVTPKSKELVSGFETEEYQNEFSKPTYVMNCSVKIDSTFIPASDVVVMVDENIGNHLGDSTQKRAKILWDNRKDVLSNFLPNHVTDIEQYINEGHGNSTLNSAYTRLRDLTELLRQIEIGNHIVLRDLGMPTDAIIVDYEMPKVTTANAAMASHYSLSYVVPGSSTVSTTRFSTLLSSANMIKKRREDGTEYLDYGYDISREKGFTGANPEETIKTFEENCVLNSNRSKSCKILVGNEWQARLMLAEGKFGKAVEFVDNEGVERRGVLITNPERFRSLPLNLETPEIAAGVLVKENKIAFRDGEVLITIPKSGRGDNPRTAISLPPVTPKNEIYYTNPKILEILDTLAGDQGDHTKFTENKNYTIKRVIVQADFDTTTKLINELYAMGVPCQIDSKKHETLHDVREEIKAKKEEEENALSAVKEENITDMEP